MESISPSQEPTQSYLHGTGGKLWVLKTLYTEVGTQAHALRMAQYQLTEQMAIKESPERAAVMISYFLQSHQPSLEVAFTAQLPPITPTFAIIPDS